MLLFLSIFVVSCSNKVPGISEAKLEEIESTYGKEGRKRVENWRYLIEDNKNKNEKNKLVLVNNFINQVEFKDDRAHWKREDYWATPIETIASNGGDCEDFSLAKYFTLFELGVAQQCLRMTYVKAMPSNIPHMVLTYQCRRRHHPLVLDNLNPTILPAKHRKDLLPVYSFNVHGLWIAKQRGIGKKVGSRKRSSLWMNLLRRYLKESKAK